MKKTHYFSTDKVEEVCILGAEVHTNRLLKPFEKDIPDKNKSEGNVVFRKYSPLSVSDNNSN